MSDPTSTRSAVVGLAALSLLASGLAAAAPALAGSAASPASDGQAALARAGAGIETVGPIATVPGTGKRLSDLPVSVAVLPRGGVTNGVAPWVAVPSLSTLASVPVRVRDAAVTGDTGTVFKGTLVKGWVRVAATLRQGGAYVVEVSDAGSWNQVGTVSVSVRATIAGPGVGAGGLGASVVTGDVQWGWQSAPLPGPIGGIGVELTWSSGAVTGSGLPDGWRLAATTGSRWATLTESSLLRQALRVPGRPVAVRTDDPREARLTVKLPERLADQIRVQRRVDDGEWQTVTATGTRASAAGLILTVPVPAAATAERVKLRVAVHEDGVHFTSDPARVLRAGAGTVRAPQPSAPVPSAGRNGMVTGGSAPAVVTLTGWDGSRLIFVRSPLGVYEMPGGSAAPGFISQLTRESDGVWEFTDAQGVVTRFVDGLVASVSSSGLPVADLTWDDGGRLLAVRNEIGLTITMGYAGTDACPSASWTGSGYTAPPNGMLCRIDYPDGSRTDIGYVTVGGAAQIGLVKDPGNTGAALGWDSVGRLLAVRSALATRTALIDPAAATAVARVEYDAAGRATAVVDAPAAPGGTGVRQVLTRPVITEADLRAWVAEPGAATGVTASVRLDDASGFDMGLTYILDPTSWATLRTTDAAGLQVAARTSDVTSLVSRSRSVSGLVTAYTYNELGLVESVDGPVLDGRRGPSMSSDYDSTSNGRTTTAWSGLRAQVYDQPQFAGNDITREFWPASSSRGGLSATWRRSASFSAQAAGVWTPADADDTAGATKGWTFAVTAAGGTDLAVVVNTRPCVLVNGTCTIKDLPTGPKAVSVQIRKAPASGWFQVSAAPVGAAPAAIPFDAVSPGYALTSVAATNDVLPGAPSGVRTTYAYDDPASGRASAVTRPGGLVTTMDYEDLDPESSLWGRLTYRTTPGGQTVSTSYWPTKGSITLPTLCGGGSVRALGLPKTITRHDGASRTAYYDLRGREVASVTAGPQAGTETSCLSYTDAGQVASTVIYNTAGDLIEKTDYAYGIGGDPRVSGSTVTHGAGAAVNPGGKVTSRLTVDLHGDPVREVGMSGTVTTTTRDAMGHPLRVTITPPAGSGTTKLVIVSTYRPIDGRLASVSVNGVLAASLDYSDRTGRLQSITYPDGIGLGLDYGIQGLIDGVTVTSTDPRFTKVEDAVSRTASGRITGASMVVTGTAARTEDRSYDYDEAGRLTAARITSTREGQSPVTTTFGYSFDDQAASCGSSYAGAGSDHLRTGGERQGTAYITCHDSAGRAVSTTDPQVTGGSGTARLSYDAFGRVTSVTGVRPVSLQWQQATVLAQVSESDATGGNTVTTTMETYGGIVLDKKVVTSSGASVARYAGPFILDRSATGDAAIRAVSYSLPGGAIISARPGAKATLSLQGVDGAALVTLAVPSLSTGSAPAPGGGAALADRFGPFGEPLEVPSVKAASVLPNYGWRSSTRQETLAGTASITIVGERAYHPALGLFLAADPNVDAGDNLYSYTDGDPINQVDVTGREAEQSLAVFRFSVLSFTAAICTGIGGAMLNSGSRLFGALVLLGSAVGSGAAAGLAAKASGQDDATSALIGTAVGFASIFTLGLAGNKLVSSAGESAARSRASSASLDSAWAARQVELLKDGVWGMGSVESKAVVLRPKPSGGQALARALKESRELAKNTARFGGKTGEVAITSVRGIRGQHEFVDGIFVRTDLIIAEDVVWEARSTVRSSTFTLAVE